MVCNILLSLILVKLFNLNFLYQTTCSVPLFCEVPYDLAQYKRGPL